jgi:hypothetical protein
MQAGFDYVTVDAQRRRVYVAHTGNESLLIVNADNGTLIGQVHTGPLHGLAVNPQTGNVYTGDGEANTVSEVDPVAMKLIGVAKVDGKVDAIAFDPVLHRIYADEDDGTRMFVVDSQTMKEVAMVPLPGHKPEYLAIDPQTHKIYQNIANLSEFVIVDASKLAVVQTVPTPDIVSNHPLQLDAALRHVYVAGRNGMLETYDLDGHRVGQTKFDGRFDQCDLDSQRHLIYCAGGGAVTVFSDSGQTVSIVGRQEVDPGVHTVGADPKIGAFWAVWSAKTGDFIRGFTFKK